MLVSRALPRALAVLLVAYAFPAFAQSPITTETLFGWLTDPTFMPRFRDFKVEQVSSHDPSGHNEDRQQFVRMEGNDAVLADLQGPGAIVRIWSANPDFAGRIKIELDGKLVVAAKFEKFMKGEVYPFVKPFNQPSSAGAVSYFPLPFASRAVVKLESPRELYYQINHVKFPEGTPVQAFPGQLEATRLVPMILAAKARWENPHKDSKGRPTVTLRTLAQASLAPGRQNLGVIRLNGGRIDSLAIRTSPADWRKIVLRVYFDEAMPGRGYDPTRPDIEAPLADLFGDPFGTAQRKQSLFLGDRFWQETGRYHRALSLPMPFGSSARFEIENGEESDVSVTLAGDVKSVPFDPATTGYLHARFMQEEPIQTIPHSWLESSGERGHLVGVVQAMTGRNYWFLEGDEQIAVDGEQIERRRFGEVSPKYNGTGTEDYFNGAYYFREGLLTAPLFGVVNKFENTDPAYEFATAGAFRFHVLDAPTYRASIKAQIEHGPLNDAEPGTYLSSLVFWYSSGQAANRKQRMPEAHEIWTGLRLLSPGGVGRSPPGYRAPNEPPSRSAPTPEDKRRRNGGKRVWFAPNIGAADTLRLFTNPEEWDQARSRVEVFQIYAQNTEYASCVICGENNLTNLLKVGFFQKLRLWGMDLGIEMGAVKPGDCDARGNSVGVRRIFERLKEAGGFVRYISLDDPKASGDLMPREEGGCKQDVRLTAEGIARFVIAAKQAHAEVFPGYPPLEVGLVEYYPGTPMQEILDMITMIEGLGAKLDFFHPDLDYNAVKNEGTSDQALKADLLLARGHNRDHGMRFGHIFFGWDGKDPYSYWKAVQGWTVKVRLLTGAPEDIKFQSWTNTPQADGSDVRLLPYNLPESNPLTHTGIINWGLWLLGLGR
jgi:hypothetical protein